VHIFWRKTVETVFPGDASAITALKRGVNERLLQGAFNTQHPGFRKLKTSLQ
jgi:hypothetical protein